MNYGIRTGLVNNIVVIDLDGPEARAWWDALGIGDSSAVVYSPRANGGQHHYFRVYDIEIKTSSGELHPNVDVRGEGGLVAGPGSQRKDGAYVGNIANIPDAPQALLDILPEKQSYQSVVDVVKIAELEATPKAAEPTDSELSDIAHIEAWLLALPRKWSAGDGWHDTVYRSSCWLWRMVRTPSYAITEAKAVEILLSSTPTWPEWGDDEILKQWDSARDSTRGEYADPPVEELPELLDFVDMANALPAFAPISQLEFLAALGDPKARVQNLADECLAAGLDVHQTVSVIHGSAAGERIRGDDYALRKLWRDVGAAEAKRIKGQAPTAEVAVPITTEAKRPQAVSRETELVALLSPAERESIAGFKWWGTEYLDWAREVVPAWNGPYHRMNRWTILSLIFSPIAVIPFMGGSDMYLNFFSFILGKTTTGKSESLKLMNSVLRTFFSDEDDPDIGGDPSPSALGAKLIERDGKASLFNRDEAHGQIAQMKQDKGYLVGLMQQLTLLYDGEMPKMLRATNAEISGKRATAYFSIHYMGTFGGITDVLEPEDWESGFLPRFIWAVGEEHERTRDSLRRRFRKPGTGRAHDGKLMQKQWAAQFRGLTMRLAPAGEPAELDMDDAMHERFVSLQERMYEVADERPEMRERLYPSVRRMSDNILKAAALVAVSDGRTLVETRDLLIAIEQGEEWFGNLLQMVTATDTSKHVRAVSAIESLVENSGGEMRMEDVYRRSGDTKYATDILVTQLVAEGRVERVQLQNGKQSLKTIGRI